MNEEIKSEIRNKLTVTMIALERLTKGESVPKSFLEKALKELKRIVILMRKNDKPSKFAKEHLLVLKLGGAERVCIHIRDTLFDGSWNKMLKHIRKKGSLQQKSEIPMIKRLQAYEKKYRLNLSKMEE